MKKILLLGLLLITGCDGEDGEGSGDGGACETLCTDAGYDGGLEEEFSDGSIVECTCDGSGDPIDQGDCDAYCVDFDIETALLSGDSKCVCDGTQM